MKSQIGYLDVVGKYTRIVIEIEFHLRHAPFRVSKAFRASTATHCRRPLRLIRVFLKDLFQFSVAGLFIA
jgi:hypothetical protein